MSNKLFNVIADYDDETFGRCYEEDVCVWSDDFWLVDPQDYKSSEESVKLTNITLAEIESGVYVHDQAREHLRWMAAQGIRIVNMTRYYSATMDGFKCVGDRCEYISWFLREIVGEMQCFAGGGELPMTDEVISHVVVVLSHRGASRALIVAMLSYIYLSNIHLLIASNVDDNLEQLNEKAMDFIVLLHQHEHYPARSVPAKRIIFDHVNHEDEFFFHRGDEFSFKFEGEPPRPEEG